MGQSRAIARSLDAPDSKAATDAVREDSEKAPVQAARTFVRGTTSGLSREAISISKGTEKIVGAITWTGPDFRMAPAKISERPMGKRVSTTAAILLGRENT